MGVHEARVTVPQLEQAQHSAVRPGIRHRRHAAAALPQAGWHGPQGPCSRCPLRGRQVQEDKAGNRCWALRRGTCQEIGRLQRGDPEGCRSGQAELMEHQRLIELLPAFLHLAIDQSIDDEPLDRDWLPCRSHWTERTCVRARATPMKGHRIPFDDLLVNSEVQIGKGKQEACDELLPWTDTTDRFRNASDMNDAVRQKHLIGDRHITAIEPLDPDALVGKQESDSHDSFCREI